MTFDSSSFCRVRARERAGDTGRVTRLAGRTFDLVGVHGHFRDRCSQQLRVANHRTLVVLVTSMRAYRSITDLLIVIVGVLVLAGCWTTLRFARTTPSRPVPSDELGQAVRATSRIALRGTAFLRPGRYELPDIEGARVEVPAEASVAYRIDVSVEPGEGDLVGLRVEEFELEFTPHLVAARGFLSAHLDRIALEQTQAGADIAVAADIELGRSIALTLARLVVRGTDEDRSDARALLARAVVDRMDLELRPNAVLDVSGHHLVIDEGSHVIVKDASITPEDRAVAGILGIHLRLASGTRLVDGPAAFELRETASLELSTAFERSAAGLTLESAPRLRDIRAELEPAGEDAETPPGADVPAVEVAPGELTLGAATFRAESGQSFEIVSAQVRVPDLTLRAGRLRASVEARAELGPSTLRANGAAFAFQSAQVDDVRVSGAHLEAPGESDELRVRLAGLRFVQPSFTWEQEGEQGAVVLGGESLEVSEAHGAHWDRLSAGAAALTFVRPRFAWSSGGGRLAATAAGDVAIGVHIGPRLTIAAGQPSPDGLSVSGSWSSIVFERPDEATATLTDVPMAVTMTSLRPPRGSAVLSARDIQVQTSGEMIGAVLPSMRIRLEDQLHAQVDGAEVSLGAERVLARVRAGIPDSYLSDIQNVTNDLQSAAMGLIPVVQGRITDIGRYREWSTQMEVDGLRGLQIVAQDGGIRLTGTVNATAIVRANKQHIKTDICYRRVLGARIPYPCIHTWHSVVEVERLRFQISVDGTVTAGTNAPAPLRDLALQLRPRFDYVNLHGLQNDVERILLRRTYDRLQDRTISLPLGSALAGELGGVGATDVHVREANVSIDPSRISTRLSFSYGPQ